MDQDGRMGNELPSTLGCIHVHDGAADEVIKEEKDQGDRFSKDDRCGAKQSD